MRRWLWLAGMLLGLAALAAGLMGLRHSLGWVGGHGGVLRLVDRGTLANTSFEHRPASHDWAFGGSAPTALRFTDWHPGRLAVGVDDSADSAFHGYFAVTRHVFAADTYVQATVEPLTVHPEQHQTAETVVAVQTGWTKATGMINYIVVSNLAWNGHKPLVEAGYAFGNIRDAHTLMFESAPAQRWLPRNRPYVLTIRTDGRHLAKVWIGSRLFYASDHLDLAIAPPFQVYLEVQARHIRYAAAFAGFAVYRGNSVRITGLPAGSRLSFAGRHEHLSASAGPRGDASLRLHMPWLQDAGTLTIAAAGGRRWSFPGLTLAGGDSLVFSTLPPYAWWLRWLPPAPWLRPLG